ncbi:PLP-dependent aminotransferase family protein [Mesorhizobium sp. CN5-321]|uniref:aminotransferase-like domain-containing protein n=1 Tax=Mesorhizobium hunchu TaxID=3157708 RepID=UPI0032B85861
MTATRTEMVMATVRRRIAGRSLAPGAKLPSLRALAASLGVSVSTVVEAYERLAAEGLVHSRPGSGFYVAQQGAPFSPSASGPRLDRAVDPFWVSRQSLESAEGVSKPGCGWLPPDWLPNDGIRKGLRALARAPAVSLAEYASPLGSPPLRQLLAKRLADRAIDCPPDQIMLTESGTQAMDLLCRLLLEPGDAVLVDDPCYFNFQALLRAHRAKLVSVPYTPSGPDVDLFEKALTEHRPRLYITNSAIHNPTGATLSPVTAHKVLKLAERAGLTIIEDDLFADFERSPAPRLAAFDGLERVVTIGSFSKTISASVRCGFIASKPGWIEQLIDLKIATAFGGGRLNADLVLNVLGDGGYRKHMEGLRTRLAAAMSTVASRLRQIGIEPWLMPQAGMFLWCRLPHDADAADLARAAMAKGFVLAPGNVFSVSQSAPNFMRFNVSQMADEGLFDFLRQALR